MRNYGWTRPSGRITEAAGRPLTMALPTSEPRSTPTPGRDAPVRAPELELPDETNPAAEAAAAVIGACLRIGAAAGIADAARFARLSGLETRVRSLRSECAREFRQPPTQRRQLALYNLSREIPEAERALAMERQRQGREDAVRRLRGRR